MRSFRSYKAAVAAGVGFGLGTCVAVTGPSAGAAVLVNDGFETTTHPALDRTAAVPPGIPFFTRYGTSAGTATIVADTGAGGLGSNVLAVADTDTSSSTAMPVIGLLPSNVTLDAVGDSVTLNFRFRFTNTGTANPSSNALRFGFHNSNNTLIAADADPASDNDIGYYAALGQGTSAPATNQVFYEETGGTANILGGTDRASLAASTAGVTFNDNAVHTVALTLTRTATNAVNLSLVVDGGAPITANDTASLRTAFDEIAFGGGFGTSGQAYNLDDVTVEYTPVPEPTTLGLVGATVLPWLFRRRRRRSS